MFEQDLIELENSNERNKSALKKVNDVLDIQVVVHNGVHLKRTEAIHRNFSI